MLTQQYKFEDVQKNPVLRLFIVKKDTKMTLIKFISDTSITKNGN